jgi:hypothetical protein
MRSRSGCQSGSSTCDQRGVDVPHVQLAQHLTGDIERLPPLVLMLQARPLRRVRLEVLLDALTGCGLSRTALRATAVWCRTKQVDLCSSKVRCARASSRAWT